MCVFIYITFMTYKIHFSGNVEESNTKYLHRRVVLGYVPSSLRSCCQAGGSQQYPEMIHSFLLTQSIPISTNYYVSGMFPACSVCVCSIWSSNHINCTIWFNFCPSIWKYKSKKKEAMQEYSFGIGEHTCMMLLFFFFLVCFS